MSTRPMPLVSLPPEQERDLRLRTPFEIRAVLRKLAEDEVPLTLAAPDGLSYTTCLWAEDAASEMVVLAADASDPRVQSLAEGGEAVAVGYLDSVKVQFDLQDLVLVHGRDASALHARFPQIVYRFQRRDGYRVRPPGQSGPELRIRYRGTRAEELRLRVFDLSHGGLSLFLPAGQPDLAVGTAIEAGTLVLEPGLQVQVAVRVVHVDAAASPAAGRRVGCEIEGLSGQAEQALQRYIDRAQRRHRLLSV